MIRSKWIDLFNSYNAKIKIVYVEPEKIMSIYERNRQRDDPVPDKVIQDLLKKLEIPDHTETHTVEYIIN